MMVAVVIDLARDPDPLAICCRSWGHLLHLLRIYRLQFPTLRIQFSLYKKKWHVLVNLYSWVWTHNSRAVVEHEVPETPFPSTGTCSPGPPNAQIDKVAAVIWTTNEASLLSVRCMLTAQQLVHSESNPPGGGGSRSAGSWSLRATRALSSWCWCRINLSAHRLNIKTTNNCNDWSWVWAKFTCLRFWEKWARGIMPPSSIFWHFFMSNLASCLHPTAMAARPNDVTRGHPRLSSVFNFVHFDKAIKELSDMDVQ